MSFKGPLRPAEELDSRRLLQPKYVEVLQRERELKDHFIRFQSNGQLPDFGKKEKKPEISEEELHRRRLEQIERETYQKAFAAGEKAGLELGEQKMVQVIKRVESSLREIDGLPRRIMAASEHFMVETAIRLVKELLRHELATQPEGIAARVKSVMDQAPGREEMVIHLGPESARVLSGLKGYSNLRIQADPTIPEGSVRLQSDFGGAYYNLDEQLREVEESLREYLHARLEEQGVTTPPTQP